MLSKQGFLCLTLKKQMVGIPGCQGFMKELFLLIPDLSFALPT